MRCLVIVALVPFGFVSSAAACSLQDLDAAGVPIVRPVDGDVASPFGIRFHTLLNTKKMHSGIDFKGETGDAVHAVASGLVAFAGHSGELGNTIEIVHGDGAQTVYGHLSKTEVLEGACVEAGAKIGLVGSTGLSAGPHLHFELRRHGEAVDPAGVLNILHIEPVDTAAAWITVDRSALLDAVIATVEEQFIDKTLLQKIAWKEKALARRAAILSAPTTADAVYEINNLLAFLETSHTSLFTPEDVEYYILRDTNFTHNVGLATQDLRVQILAEKTPPLPGIGLFSKLVSGHYHIDGVLEGSPADLAGLKVGDEIISVDGAPYYPVSSFQEKVGQTVKLLVRRRAGADPETVELAISREQLNASAAFTKATLASARVFERNGKHIGYVHLWGFGESALETALGRIEPINRPSFAVAFSPATEPKSKEHPVFEEPALFPPAIPSNAIGSTSNEPVTGRPLDYLIVDARGKVGGNISVVHQTLRSLSGPFENFIGNHRTENLAVWHSANRTLAVEASPKSTAITPAPFRGRSALLIDHHTRSAGEIFSFAWKRGKFGPIFGTRTKGAVVSGGTFLTPGGLLLYVAKIGHRIDGQVLEGKGVEPDHMIERPVPYSHGADPVLEAALDKLAGPATK